tara:strand:- start:732 stop:1346 length:615 start_codon:yes stop_codon:yes gene_type:complete
MSDEGKFPEEFLEEGRLSMCHLVDCDIPGHRISTRDKAKHGRSRADFYWLEDAVQDSKENGERRLVAFNEEKLQDYSVNMVVDLGHKQPSQFQFEVQAENLYLAQMKAMSFWQDACAHMDTGAHLRMGLYGAMALHDGSIEEADIHYGINLPSNQYNEPLLITISNAKRVGVMHANGLKPDNEGLDEQLAKDFQGFFKSLDEEE